MRNDLETAYGYGQQVLELRYQCGAEAYANGLAVVARIQQVWGETDKAQNTNEALTEWARETGNAHLMIIALGEASALALMRGEIPEIEQWSTTLEDDFSPARLFSRPPHLTAAWALIIEGSSGALKQAATWLQQVRQAAKTSHNKWHLIEVFALQALLKDRQDDQAAALKHLETALELAQPRGFVRTFVDLGAPMAKLLSALPNGEKQGYVQELLSLFDPTVFKYSSNDKSQVDLLPLRDSLTDREMDILKLLAQGQTNREIALQLTISPHTVNYHLKNIFSKLDVHDRRQAGMRAQELGLLPA
jgi:LuxR family maltose regulon positive regulatory protein